MAASLQLSRRLNELCTRACGRCSPTQHDAIGDERGSAAGKDVVGAATAMKLSAIRQHWEHLPKPRCDRCEFLLLLQAIDNLIPVEAVSDWLKTPSVDLDGLCPMDCIDAGVYEPIFQALFLHDSRSPALSS